MKAIEVKVDTIRDGVVATARIALQKQKNGRWEDIEAYDVSSDDPDSERRILLEDDEQIVITAKTMTEMMLDRDQMVARAMPVDPVEKDKALKEEERVRRENIEREERERHEATTAEGRKTLLGRPVPPQTPADKSVSAASNAKFAGPGSEKYVSNEPPVEPKPKVEPTKTPSPTGAADRSLHGAKDSHKVKEEAVK